MKYMTAFALGALLLAGLSYSLAHEAGAPPGYAGALGQPNCAASGCHTSFPVNSGPGYVTAYEAGYPAPDTVIIEAKLVGTGGSRVGFQASQRAPYNAYHMQPGWMDSERVQLQWNGDTAYFGHSLAGSTVAPGDTVPRWRFAYAVGDSVLYADLPCPWVFVSAVAADGDGTPAGDYVYTNQSDFYGGLCFCRWGWMPGDLNFDGSFRSGDIIALVSIIFRGAPLPEPCDIADPDCSGAITASDLIFLVNTVFKGGPWPCGGCDYSSLLFSDLYCQ